MNNIYNKLLHLKFLSPGDCEVLFRMAAKRHTYFASTLVKIILSHHCGLLHYSPAQGRMWKPSLVMWMAWHENACMSQTSSTSSPTGYVLSPLIFFLPTNSSTSSYQSVNLMKLTDDTTSIGLITDKSAYSGDIENLFYSMLTVSL